MLATHLPHRTHLPYCTVQHCCPEVAFWSSQALTHSLSVSRVNSVRLRLSHRLPCLPPALLHTRYDGVFRVEVRIDWLTNHPSFRSPFVRTTGGLIRVGTRLSTPGSPMTANGVVRFALRGRPVGRASPSRRGACIDLPVQHEKVGEKAALSRK